MLKTRKNLCQIPHIQSFSSYCTRYPSYYGCEIISNQYLVVDGQNFWSCNSLLFLQNKSQRHAPDPSAFLLLSGETITAFKNQLNTAILPAFITQQQHTCNKSNAFLLRSSLFFTLAFYYNIFSGLCFFPCKIFCTLF